VGKNGGKGKMMFIGEYAHSLDQKGRVAIPAKCRPQLATGCVITRGLDGCLFIYSEEEWNKIAKKLSQLPLSQSDARAFARLMLAGAMQLDIDKQGRIVIPSYLREYASLKSNIIITGLANRLELWEESVWKNYKNSFEKDSADIAEHLGDLGI
jgi:MraZ protein